jgi:hypothetical protein
MTPKNNRDNCIDAYMHCGRCLKEKPADVSPRDWARLECGWTTAGFQVWCKRHECNIIHVDFEGVKHKADTRRNESKEDKNVN